MIWRESHRFDTASLPLADRHYNRRKVGSPQFVPPGRCIVLRSTCNRALWVTSWPFERALHVLDGAPFWGHTYGHERFARLSIEGGEATIRWQDTESDYDGWRTYEDSTSFPATLLTMPADELAAFKARAAEEEKRKAAREQEARVREAEAKERRLLAKLQQKYAR